MDPAKNRINRRRYLYALCVGLIIGMIAGAVYLFNDIYPKAQPINLPKMEDIISVSLARSDSDVTVPMGEEDREKLFEYLGKGTPTRQQAINDSPTESSYYSISLQTAEREYRYYVYAKGGGIYIEAPYEGIYQAEIALLHLLSTAENPRAEPLHSACLEIEEIGLTLILPDSWNGRYALEQDDAFKEYYVYHPAQWTGTAKRF